MWAIGKKASQVEASSNIIPMQYEQLSTLADQSHGRLVTMTIDDQDVSKVNQFIKHNLIIIEDESRPWLDSGYLLTFVIAFLFLFWFRKGWTLQW